MLSPCLVPLQPGERGRAVAAQGDGTLVLTWQGRLYLLGAVEGRGGARARVVSLSDLALPHASLPTSAWLVQGEVLFSCRPSHPATVALTQAELAMLSQATQVSYFLGH